MKRLERIQAALAGQEVDRIPVNLWMHHSDVDQDPLSLAEAQVAHAREYDFDFIKLMPFGLYAVQDYGAKVRIYSQVNRPPVVETFGISETKDWATIEPLPAHHGTLGKQVQLARHVQRLSRGEFPFIQTIFSPLTNARKLAGDRILLDMKRDPVLFKQALQAFTDTTVAFVRANIEAGASGFFFATQCATRAFMTEDEYREFGVPFDLQVIEAFAGITPFNVLHIHGEQNLFDLLEPYPVHALSWHDRWVPPTLAQARTRTNKCLIGGVRETPFFAADGTRIRGSLLVDGSVSEVEEHVWEAFRQTSGRGFILGPGCVVDQLARPTNLWAARRAVETFSAVPAPAAAGLRPAWAAGRPG